MTECFVCAADCSKSNGYNCLINLQSKKYKSQYTSLIGNLINSEYELRVHTEDRLCENCILLLEKYDELQQETNMVKSVLSRQIALRYSIETDQQLVYLDKSKIFYPIRNSSKFNCKHCPLFISDNVDEINHHVLYHQYLLEEQEKSSQQVQMKNNQNVTLINKATTAVSTVAGELTKIISEEPKLNTSRPTQIEIPSHSMEQQILNVQHNQEDPLDSLIDLNILDDEYYDSNLKDHNCTFKECKENFKYASEYVRHLKIKHKMSLNHLFAALKSNLKRPTKLTKLMCPYCFTKTSDSNALEDHVKIHEFIESQPSIFINRVNSFVNSVIKEARCDVCNSNILEPHSLKCNHLIARNGLARKFDCKDCDAYFYEDKLYNNHIALEHSTCFFCGWRERKKKVLKDHIKHHYIAKSEFPCAFCNDIYLTQLDQRNHIQLKHNKNCCQFCDEWFINIVELEHHTRYVHADKRYQERPQVCDTCGLTFKNKIQYESHLKNDHKAPRKCYKCSKCPNTFEYRYLMMDHFANVHKRTIVDNEANFYKCCFCNQTFASQARKNFLQHLQKHQMSQSYCYDCNMNFDSRGMLDDHREKSHQDFSRTVDKKPLININNDGYIVKTQPMVKAAQTAHEQLRSLNKEPKKILTTPTQHQQPQQHRVMEESTQEFSHGGQQPEQQPQQIIVQSENGNIINMNNLILTENGELIIQNFDDMIPNGAVQESDEGSAIQIDNLEQFLLEQGISANTEISYIQEGNGNLVALQNDVGTLAHATQDNLLEIFEPQEITSELLSGETEDVSEQNQNIILNGEYVIQQDFQPQIQIQVDNQPLNAVNQTTLDELGDILLEVAAAAEKEKKPKNNNDSLRESLWGKKRPSEPSKENSTKRRNGNRNQSIAQDLIKPAANFSQAYEQFVKGFDASKKKIYE